MTPKEKVLFTGRVMKRRKHTKRHTLTRTCQHAWPGIEYLAFIGVARFLSLHRRYRLRCRLCGSVCVCVCTYIVCCVGNTLHVQNYLLYISVIVLCQLLIYELPCHKLIWTFWNVPMGPNVPEYWPILDGCFVQEMVLVMVVTVRI